ncbi:MAG: TonB family protein, partial [Nitrospiraceae bacterium]
QGPLPKHRPLRTVEPKTPVQELAKAPPSEPPAESLSQASRSAVQASPVPEPVPAVAPAEPIVASRSPIEAPPVQAHIQQSDLGQVTTAEGTSSAVPQPQTSDASVQTGPAGSPDYGWVADALWRRIEQLKRYPHLARINRLEGKVVLRAVIKADGQLVDLVVATSSGHSVLDHDALEVLRRASPLPLTRPLGKPQMVVQIPISYKLDR